MKISLTIPGWATILQTQQVLSFPKLEIDLPSLNETYIFIPLTSLIDLTSPKLHPLPVKGDPCYRNDNVTQTKNSQTVQRPQYSPSALDNRAIPK
ncbi:hypothetical protein RRG08_044160 [Elysia crispata]|uniref:Uncharacterized protein n=1 Tax=Elysia crispata TaxID=231223 RepID=A0AAE0XWM5_9GAST|nr:hypothetical protein RRG08_044160 [Elysia crispata]